MRTRVRNPLGILFGFSMVAMVLVGVSSIGAQPTPDPETDERQIELLGLEFGGSRTFTKPSKDAEIGFQVPTQVMEVPVSGGDRVEEGDLLIRGDDAEEMALLEIQKMRAETDLPVLRAQEQFELAKVEFEMQTEAYENGGATEQEVNRARVNMRIAELDVDQAKQNLEQERLQYERLKARSTRFRLTAPFDGRVASVEASPGDTVQESQPIVRVVRIDPLWIDVNAPVRQTIRMGLSEGDPAWAMVDVATGARVVKGRIIEVSPVAEFASRQRRVRVEIPNPEKWPPGLATWVRFDPPPARWEKLTLTRGDAPAPSETAR